MASDDAVAVPGIEGTARLVGAYVWFEERLYLQLGEWAAEAASSSEPSLHIDAVYLDTVSQHHAWRGQLLAGHIPEAGGADAERLVSSPGEVADRLLGALEALAPGARRPALAGVVHPWLAERYRNHLTHTYEVSDGPLRRALELAVFDLDRDQSAAGADLADAGEELAQVRALRRDQGERLFPWTGP